MMTPDSETHVRVWKFRIKRNFFQTRPYGVRARPIKKLQRVIVARQQQDFVCPLARDPTRISDVQIEIPRRRNLELPSARRPNEQISASTCRHLK
jgi:hypothetical protein